LERQGSVFGNHRQVNQTELVPTCHETTAVVQLPACDDAWRWFTEKRFYGKSSALVKAAKRFSTSALIVTAGIVTAAPTAAIKLAAGSGGAPTDATNRALRGGSTIAIASRRIGAACATRNRA
jgi:hypothetical protein